MKIWRSSLYQDPFTFPPPTMSARECDLKAPIEEVLQTKKIPGGLTIDEIIEVDHDVEEMEMGLLVVNRLKERQKAELNMAILYFWSAMQLERVNPRGVLATTKVAPLTVSEIITVLGQLQYHSNWKQQTVRVIAQCGEVVTLASDGAVVAEMIPN